MHWKTKAIAALALAAGGAVLAQDALKADETHAAEVDKLFEKIDTTVTPGCALSVMQGGRIVYERGYGMADLDHNVAIMPTTVFHVASMSKQFTAAAIVMLAQQGKLSFDDPVQKYIPEMHDFGAPVTIRDLIHHTSGLRDQWDLLELAGWRYSRDLITDQDILSVVTRQKELNFAPNTRFLYSNTGYTLLGQIVKRVSGKSLREFTSENIFAPLGMKSTHFRDDHAEIVKNMAYGYEPAAGKFKIGNTNFDTVGATSLLTTVEDLQHWDENFYEPRVGGQAMVKQMLEQGRLNSGEQIGYAFGLDVGTDRGLRTVDHAGGDAGYRSDMIRFPDQHFTVACLCNSAAVDPGDLTRKVAAIYLAKEMKPEEKTQANDEKGVELTPEQVNGKAGTYLKADTDDVIRFLVKDGKLRVSNGLDEMSFELKARDANHFKMVMAPVDFSFSAAKAGGPLEMTLREDDEKPAVYRQVDPFTPTAAQIEEYAGLYSSEEIDPVYELKVEKDALVLVRLKHDPETLKPVARDLFAGPVGTLRFARDAQGRVAGFMISTGRILNLRFARGRPAIPAR